MSDFALLKIEPLAPRRDYSGNTTHGIVFMFAKTSAVTLNSDTIEASSHDIKQEYLAFRAGDDLASVVNGLRDMATHLEAQTSA